MIKVLEAAIEKVKALPDEQQVYAAEILEQLAATFGETEPEDEATLAAIAEGLAQAERGEFVPDEEMEAFFKSHGV